jgi:NTP pyrophosphatase (non-canonical NTP hydrolase)
MKKLLDRSYQACLDRGVINSLTTRLDFIKKINEECDEVKEAYYKALPQSKYVEELTDLATVCIMQIHHLGGDFEEEFEKGVLKNEKRAIHD